MHNVASTEKKIPQCPKKAKILADLALRRNWDWNGYLCVCVCVCVCVCEGTFVRQSQNKSVKIMNIQNSVFFRVVALNWFFKVQTSVKQL